MLKLMDHIKLLLEEILPQLFETCLEVLVKLCSMKILKNNNCGKNYPKPIKTNLLWPQELINRRILKKKYKANNKVLLIKDLS